jgi:sarcosine oxidase
MAQAHGATLSYNAPVTAVHEVGDEIEVVAGDTTYRCGKLVVTAGAWSNHILARFGLELPLTVTQEQAVYCDTPHAADFRPDRFPIWTWTDQPCFYGFPVYGEAGPKVSQDAGGKAVTAETRRFKRGSTVL